MYSISFINILEFLVYNSFISLINFITKYFMFLHMGLCLSGGSLSLCRNITYLFIQYVSCNFLIFIKSNNFQADLEV